jgi:DNA-directed RNA polymerase specialized sigma24 family protein
MKKVSFELLEGLIASPAEEEGNENRPRLARAAWQVYENELTARQKLCIELCALRGMTVAEAAHQLGISPQAVHRHLVAGKKRMSDILHYCLTMLY